MKKNALTLIAAAAADMGHDMGHMPMNHDPDLRKPVEMPAMMHDHMEANMRAHLIAVADIMAALAAGDGPKAAKISDGRLSLASPHSAACKPGAEKGGKMGDQASMMAANMAKHMPDEMRALGYTMHEQASAFSAIASKMKPGDDVRPALAQLANVTQACGACHAAYKLK